MGHSAGDAGHLTAHDTLEAFVNAATATGTAVVHAADVATARAALGLGTAATHPSTDFDSAGAASAAQSAAATDATTKANSAQAAATAASQGAWNPRGVTGATTAAAWDYVLADTTGGTFAVAAPTPTAGKQFAVKWKAGTTAPTLTGTFNSSPVISVLDQAIEFISDGTTWYRTVRPALAQLPDYPAVTDTRYAGQVTKASVVATGLAPSDIGAASASALFAARSFHTGRSYGCVSGATATLSTVNGAQYATPFYVSVTQAFTAIGIEVITAGTSGAALVRLAIHNDDPAILDFPGTVLLDAGTVAADTTGWKTIAITQTLTPGLYWLTSTTQGTPATAPTYRAIAGTSPRVSVSAAAAVGAIAYSRTSPSQTGAHTTWVGATEASQSSAPWVRLVV